MFNLPNGLLRSLLRRACTYKNSSECESSPPPCATASKKFVHGQAPSTAYTIVAAIGPDRRDRTSTRRRQISRLVREATREKSSRCLAKKRLSVEVAGTDSLGEGLVRVHVADHHQMLFSELVLVHQVNAPPRQRLATKTPERKRFVRAKQ